MKKPQVKPQVMEPPLLLPIAKADGDCPVCRGPLVAVRTFDGFENIECLPSDQCFGCRRAGAPVERFGNGGGRNRDLFSTTPQEGQA